MLLDGVPNLYIGVHERVFKLKVRLGRFPRPSFTLRRGSRAHRPLSLFHLLCSSLSPSVVGRQAMYVS